MVLEGKNLITKKSVVENLIYENYFFSIQNGFAGIHAGSFGGLVGSPIFGPGGIGPFNNPQNRQRRIDELVNTNRLISGRGPVAPFRRNPL